MKAIVLLVLLAVAIGAVVWFSNQGRTPANDGPQVSGTPTGGAAPAASDAAEIAGASFKTADYKGQVLVMDFWATWCGPCRAAMPGVQKLHDHFKGRAVKVVGVNCSERGGDPMAHMKQNGFTYTTVTGGDSLAQHYNIRSIPTFIILGSTGSN